jgi:hypothetical protein
MAKLGSRRDGVLRVLPEEKFAFLVIGAGRGGTSLIAALLDTHTELEVGFERHAQECLMGKALDGPGKDDIHVRMEAFIASCNADAQRSPARLWGNKVTTEQIFGLEDHNAANPSSPQATLEVFFNGYFRDRKVVFILRDGRACVASKVRRAGRPYELACERWRYCVQCYRFLRERHQHACFVRFEDLLYQPVDNLDRICDFLAVPFQPEMLEGVGNAKLAPEYRNVALDTTKASTSGFPAEHLATIREELEYCGYQV